MTDDNADKNLGYVTMYRGAYPANWTSSMIIIYNDIKAYSNGSGHSFVSQGTIAKNWGMNIDTVNVSIRRLIECKAIALERRSNDHNEYVITGKITGKPLSDSNVEITGKPLPGHGKTVTSTSKITGKPLPGNGKTVTKLNKRKLDIKEKEIKAPTQSAEDKRKKLLSKIQKDRPDYTDKIVEALSQLCQINIKTARQKVKDEYKDCAVSLLECDKVSAADWDSVKGIIDDLRKYYSKGAWWWYKYNEDTWAKTLPISQIMLTWRQWPQ